MAKKRNSEDSVKDVDVVETQEVVVSEPALECKVSEDSEKEHQLSAAEQFYIESHRNSTDEEIAEVLELDKDFVTNKRMELQVTFEKKQPSVVDLSWNPKLHQWEDKEGNIYNGPAVNVDDVKETVEVKKQVVAGIKAGDLIGRNEKQSVAVMTGGASQMADIIKGARQRLIPSCVHQPKKK